MADHVQFVENVVLIDLAGFNESIDLVHHFFEDQLGRKVDNLNLEEWISCMAMDAGIVTGKNRIQIIFLYEGEVAKIELCNAPDLDVLKKTVFSSSLGDFVFSFISSEGLVPRDFFFLELMDLALDSADVKRLILIPDNEAYGDKVHDSLLETLPKLPKDKSKDITRFFTAMLDHDLGYKCDSLIFSMMHCMDIHNDDLGFLHDE